MLPSILKTSIAKSTSYDRYASPEVKKTLKLLQPQKLKITEIKEPNQQTIKPRFVKEVSNIGVPSSLQAVSRNMDQFQ